MYVMVIGCVQPISDVDQGVGTFVLERLGDERAWCAVDFPDLAAADACATALQSAHTCHHDQMQPSFGAPAQCAAHMPSCAA